MLSGALHTQRFWRLKAAAAITRLSDQLCGCALQSGFASVRQTAVQQPPRESTFQENWSNSLQHRLSVDICQQLTQQGWAVVQDAVDARACAELRRELQGLRAQGHMRLNCTHLVRGNATELLEKSNIWEADMMSPEVRQAAHLCSQMLQDGTLRTLLSIYIPHLRLDGQSMKLQINAGQGACFPLHHDSDESLDARRMTAILYLSPQWQEADGGQLRLYPLLTPPVDIPPKAGTLVLFPSCRMLHRVMPSSVERHCITVWLSQTRLGHNPPTHLKSILSKLPKNGDAASTIQHLLAEPEVRKHLSKIKYAQEWAGSLEQSHPDNQQRADALAQFWQEVEVLKRELGFFVPGGDIMHALSGMSDMTAQRQRLPVSWV